MIELFPDQQGIINAIRAAFRGGYRSPLLVSPTGSGKTVMFSFMAARVSEKGKRVYILVHRDELVDQVSGTLCAFNVNHSFIAAGRIYDRRLPVQVASVFTLARRLDRIPPPDLLIEDEAHHAIAGSTWGEVMQVYLNALRLGVTATPERLDGTGLKDSFDTMILGQTTRQLIESGRLSDYRLFAPPGIDVSGVHSRMGDYVRSELAAAVDKATITGDVIGHYKKYADGMPSVAFCVSIKHAEHVAEQFRAAGYRSVSIDGKMDREMRRQIIRDFQRGGINVLTSCDLISEGFDCPGMVGAILLRPTQSLALHLQQCGRSLRKFPGKQYAVILDHAGNSAKHGLPDDERQWGLEGRDKKARKNDNDLPGVRVCKKCFAAVPPWAPTCRFCGTLFEAKPRVVAQVDGELEEVDVHQARLQKLHDQQEMRSARTLDDLVALGRSRGYKRPEAWAAHVWTARQAARRSVA